MHTLNQSQSQRKTKSTVNYAAQVVCPKAPPLPPNMRHIRRTTKFRRRGLQAPRLKLHGEGYQSSYLLSVPALPEDEGDHGLAFVRKVRLPASLARRNPNPLPHRRTPPLNRSRDQNLFHDLGELKLSAMVTLTTSLYLYLRPLLRRGPSNRNQNQNRDLFLGPGGPNAKRSLTTSRGQCLDQSQGQSLSPTLSPSPRLLADVHRDVNPCLRS